VGVGFFTNGELTGQAHFFVEDVAIRWLFPYLSVSSCTMGGGNGYTIGSKPK